MTKLQKIETAARDRRLTRERRKVERVDARGASVSIVHDGGVKAAVCGDVSQAGARLSLDRPLAVGEMVTVGFGPDTTLTGRVAWVDEAECGIEFAGAFAKALESPVGHGNLPVAASPRFQEGLNVTVMMPDCERKAVLRWTKDNFASFTLQH